jgi:pimeloyl-ACP methyl ester carboxylesterase
MTAERRVWLTKEGIGMRGARTVDGAIGRTVGDDLRRRLLAGAPVAERQLGLAGVSTAVLEGGEGPPVVLLHGQGGWAGVWLPVMADLARDHRVVAPDLPGLGASRVEGAPPNADRVLAWLGELLDRTCPVPPVLVGVSLGGSIAARFAAAHGDRLSGLVLVSMGGLVGKVRIPPAMLLALVRHGLRPTERTAMGMLRQVSVDVDRLQRRMGDRWAPFRAYSLELARTPSVRRANRNLLRELGLHQLPPEEVARIDVPTSLIWGRQDRVMPLAAAEEAGARYGWPLDVIDDAGHFLGADQPEAFLQAVRRALHRV